MQTGKKCYFPKEVAQVGEPNEPETLIGSKKTELGFE
jgi:hypothetical protein